MNLASWTPIARQSTELRSTSRADVHVEIDVVSEHNFWSGITSNISEGGVFIATHHVVPIGSRLYVQFSIDDGGPPIVALTEVRWVRDFRADSLIPGRFSALRSPPGLGVQFVDLPDDALRRIKAFVKRRPSLLFED